MRRFACHWLLAMAYCVGLFAADFAVRAYVDRSEVGVGEQFTLSVELSGAEANQASDPQPPDLDEFARYLGSGTNTSVEIVNGRMSSRKTLNLFYQTTQEGTFKIPALTTSVDGKDYSTRPIDIQVVAASARPVPRDRTFGSIRRTEELSQDDLFVQVSVNKTKVYQNEPILLTYQIYTRVSLSRYGVTKDPDRTGFWVEDLLGQNQQVQTTTEVIDGKRYTVATIRKLALFPTVTGEQTIEPLELECEVRLRPSRRNLFDDFFSDPFGRTGRYVIRSNPIKIEVRPLPTEGKPRNFNGAVGQFVLEGRVNKTRVATNDVVTLTITLSGTGNLRTVAEPELKLSPGLEAYEPELTESIGSMGSTIGGSKTYEYVLVPRRAGSHRIEAVALAYFDPDEAIYKTTTLDEIVINAQQAETTVPAIAPADAKQEVRLLAQEIRFIKLEPGDLRSSDLSVFWNPSFWLVTFLPAVGIATALLVRRRLDRLAGDLAYARDRRAGRVARTRLAKARRLLDSDTQKEFFAETARALRGFAADKMNISEAGMISEELKHRLGQSHVAEEVIEEYVECLNTSDLKHFAPVDSSLDEMKSFLSRAENAITRLNKELSK